MRPWQIWGMPIVRVNYDKLHSKLPIFRVKSEKIYTGQKKIYTGAARGARDKYEVWRHLAPDDPHQIIVSSSVTFMENSYKLAKRCIHVATVEWYAIKNVSTKRKIFALNQLFNLWNCKFFFIDYNQ